MIKYIYQFRLLIILILCATSIIAYRKRDAEIVRYSQVKMLMGTNVTVDVCAVRSLDSKVHEAYLRVWERLEDISWRMNVYDDRSDVHKINQSNVSDIVTIGGDTYDVIKQAKYYFSKTKGTFDITIWPLLKLWRDSSNTGIEPTAKMIASKKRLTGMDNISLLSKGRVKKLKEGVMIDLGGIAKGYAVDEGARILREFDFDNFYINAGGDIYVGGLNCQGEKWRIAIRDPRDKDKTVAIVKLSNAAVTTSGNYEQYYQLKKRKISHIIDPRTGYPQEGVVSSTVIAPTTMEADVYSTAFSVLKVEEGFPLMDLLGGNYASLIFIENLEEGILKRFESMGFSEFDFNP